MSFDMQCRNIPIEQQYNLIQYMGDWKEIRGEMNNTLWFHVEWLGAV